MAWGGTLVTVAATATRISSSVVDCQELTIRALPGNAAPIYFGPSTVTTTANYRLVLQAGESYTFGPLVGGSIDLKEIYYISGGAVDKFCYSYVPR